MTAHQARIAIHSLIALAHDGPVLHHVAAVCIVNSKKSNQNHSKIITDGFRVLLRLLIDFYSKMFFDFALERLNFQGFRVVLMTTHSGSTFELF